MGANTKIQWAHHTFNPWRGCTKVAAGCANCYAESQSKRNPKTLGVWGPNGTRVVASEAMWREPVKWNKAARDWQFMYDNLDEIARRGHEEPERPRVFCASLADVFEGRRGPIRCGGLDEDPWSLRIDRDSGEWVRSGAAYDSCRTATLDDVRARLFSLIDQTPNLDWLLLTKRPENVRRMWCSHVNTDGRPPSQLRRENVWLGTSIACQDDADRNIPELLQCRDLAAKLFLSIEPLVGPVNITRLAEEKGLASPGVDCLDWVIVGGESGPKARPCDIAWIRSIVRQCRGAELPVFVKQLGARCVKEHASGDAANTAYHPHGWVSQVGTAHHAGWFKFSDKKGGDPAEWPDDVRVREVPSCRA